MGRKLYIELDVDWENYDDVSDELLLEDIFDGVFVKDGVDATLIPSPIIIPTINGPITIDLSRVLEAKEEVSTILAGIYCCCPKPWGVNGGCVICGKLIKID
jgi:hypothetical protein